VSDRGDSGVGYMESKTILFVDDDEMTLSSLEMTMENEPCRCLYARSGAQALELLSQNKVHVIVTDMRMPDMSGLSLLKIVREKYPKVVRMVLSGYTQVTTLLAAINEGQIFKYITKPWRLEEEFIPCIRAALEHYDRISSIQEGKPDATDKDD
jgi:DNA-binding NtrC family response regulator